MEAEVKLNTLLNNFLHLIFKRKTQVLFVFGAIVCTVAIASFVTRPTYEATAQILVKIGREDVYMPTLPGGEASKPIVGSNRTERVNSEMQILRSRFLADRVIESLGPLAIYKDLEGTGQTLLAQAVRRFQKALRVEGVEESTVINISFSHTNPRLAATVVNTVVDLYLERHLEVHKRHDPQGFFRKQYLLLRDQTKLAEEKMQSFRNEHDLTSLEEEQNILLAQEADLRTQLNQSLSQQAEIKNRIQQLRDQQTSTPGTIPLSLDNETMNNLHARLVELELQEHELLTKYSDQSRFVKRVREEITMVRRRLGEHGSEIIQQDIARNEADLQALKAKGDTQRAQLAAIQKRHEKLNGLVLEFDRLRQAVEVLRENYRLYLTKFEQARISDAMDREKIANVRLIEPAHIPVKPVSPNIRLNIILAIVLGVFVAVGLAYFSEHLADCLERDEDVENLLHLPVLASVPEVKG